MNTPENTTTRIDGQPASPEGEGGFAAAGGTPESAEVQAARLQAEVERLRDQSLRERADVENTRKRLQKEKEEAVRYANGNLLEKLLPIVDNFELGLLEARRTQGEGSPVLVGMGMVQKQLESFLIENGLQPLEVVGQKFDPNLHEALGEESSAQVPEGHVTRQQRKGYKLRDRLLRPASVFVSRGHA